MLEYPIYKKHLYSARMNTFMEKQCTTMQVNTRIKLERRIYSVHTTNNIAAHGGCYTNTNSI